MNSKTTHTHNEIDKVVSQHIKIIQIIPILHNTPLNLGAIHPRHEILQISRNQVRRIRNDLCPDANMALLDERDGLTSPSLISINPNPIPHREEG